MYFQLTVVSMPKEENIRWLILVDFLLMECMLSLDIRLVSVLSSSVRYLSTEIGMTLCYTMVEITNKYIKLIFD